MNKKIAIVGAGIGGLASACRLASRGFEVEVFEKLKNCGGRNNLIEDKGFKFDTGPSFVLMPDFFEETFAFCGEQLKDYLDLAVLDTNYKIFFADGDTLTVYNDTARTKDELERIEKGSSQAFDKLIAETARIHKLVKPLLYRSFSPLDAFNPRYSTLITRIRALESYWQLVKKYFKSEKLCYAFTFESMFMGVSPFEAPAFYSVITYADHVQKIRHPFGGMYQIPLALEKMAKKFGVGLFYNAEVEKITKKDKSSILKIKEKETDFEKVIVNADYAYAQSKLLNRKIPRFSYSCSAYLIYLGLKKKVKGFRHHNLFFSKDMRKNLDQIFKGQDIPQDPSFYLHVPTVTDQSLAPTGKDLFYILVPVPNLEHKSESILKSEGRLRKFIFKKISAVLGENLEDLIEVEAKFYPEDFIKRYNIKYAATFGLAHNLMQSAFFRPKNYDRKIKNLYYVGASTQPGGGLPPVLASSRIVADLILSSSHLS